MLTISEFSAELVKDPFGILVGKRYEFILDLDVPDDDELYMENGVYARVLLKQDETQISIISCDLHEKTTEQYLDIELEDDEKEMLATFCKENLPE